MRMPKRSAFSRLRCVWVLACAPSVWAAQGFEPVAIRICANQALGSPEGDNSAYVLARMAFTQLVALKPLYTLLPWQRCLNEAAAGHFDAVLAASFSPERAQSLAYPLDASGQPDASRRMFEVGYTLIKRKGSAVSWDGQRFHGTGTRPGQALGAERAYSIVQFARERGAVVEDRYPQYSSLVAALKLQRIAGLLINQQGAVSLMADPSWAQDHEISGPSIQPRAYFLPVTHAFAKAQPLLTAQLWDALAKARKTPEFQRHYSLTVSVGQRRDIQP